MSCSVYRVNVVAEMMECDCWAAGLVASCNIISKTDFHFFLENILLDFLSLIQKDVISDILL